MVEPLRIFPGRVAEQGFKLKGHSASCRNETLAQQMLDGYWKSGNDKSGFWRNFLKANTTEIPNQSVNPEAFFIRLGERTSWLTPYTNLHSGDLRVITSSYFSALHQKSLPLKIIKKNLASANEIVENLTKENPGIVLPKPKGRVAYLAQRLAYAKINEAVQGEIKKYPHVARIIVRTVGAAAACLDKGENNNPSVHLLDFIDLGLIPVGIIEKEVGLWSKRKESELLVIRPLREKAA